jgi:hypothetical protein
MRTQIVAFALGVSTLLSSTALGQSQVGTLPVPLAATGKLWDHTGLLYTGIGRITVSQELPSNDPIGNPQYLSASGEFTCAPDGTFTLDLGEHGIDSSKAVKCFLQPYDHALDTYHSATVAGTDPTNRRGVWRRAQLLQTGTLPNVEYTISVGDASFALAPQIGAIRLADPVVSSFLGVVEACPEGDSIFGPFATHQEILMVTGQPYTPLYSWSESRSFMVSSNAQAGRAIQSNWFTFGSQVDVSTVPLVNLALRVDLSVHPGASRWAVFPAGQWTPHTLATTSQDIWTLSVLGRTSRLGNVAKSEYTTIQQVKPGSYKVELWGSQLNPSGNPIQVYDVVVGPSDISVTLD